MQNGRMRVYNCFVRRVRRAVWWGLCEALAQERDYVLMIINASIVKAHRVAAG